MNERSEGKTDITFELRTIENLRRGIKGKMALFTCTVLFTYTVLYMLLFTALPMMWHWLMRCHDPVVLKFLCTIDRWHGSISVDQKSHVRYMQHTGLFSTKPHHCSSRLTIQTTWSNRVTVQTAWSNRVLLTDDVAQSWASKLFLIRWPWFTQCMYKKGASPLIWHLWIHFWTPFSVIPSPSCIFYVF